jgi:tRNA A37 threonylcarbamoyladenosine biosynthesis protein TsaE
MSNIQQIQESLQSLLEGKDSFVAILSGEWGIGKTYFWKELEKENK